MGSVHHYETSGGKRLYRIVYRRPDHSQTTGEASSERPTPSDACAKWGRRKTAVNTSTRPRPG